MSIGDVVKVGGIVQIAHSNMVIKETNATHAKVPVSTIQTSFGSILNEKIDSSRKLQFTKHANMRLHARDISLSDEQLLRIENGVDMARQKGIRDSLVLVDDIALVVNTRNNTVITAMEKERNENVFTNIDGAVIV